MRSLSTSEILESIRMNDTKVLQNIYNSYFFKVKLFVLKNNGSIEDADDLFQETIICIFEKVRNGNFAISCSFSTYFFSLSKYLWIRQLNLRKQLANFTVSLDGVYSEEHLVDLDKDVVALLEDGETRRFLQKHFSQLSEKCQEMIRLFFQKISIYEISQRMGVSEKYI